MRPSVMECSLYAPRFPCRKITTVMATPEKQTLRDFDELPVGGVDEFGTIPDIDTNVPPSDLDQWSLAPSASAQMQQDLATQMSLRQLAEDKARQIRIRHVNRIANACNLVIHFSTPYPHNCE